MLFALPTDSQTFIGVGQLCLGLIVALGATWAFIVGLRQYERGQRWQKAQVLLTLIESFDSDPLIKAARQMLDWNSRNIVIDGLVISYLDSKLASALRVWGRGDNPFSDFTPEEGKIRDAFDALFDFFEKLNSLVQSRLIPFSDLTYFFYWLRRLAYASYYKNAPDVSGVFEAYVTAYSFTGTQHLTEMYRNKIKSHGEARMVKPDAQSLRPLLQ
jgi:hypothetical protein